MSIFDPYNDEVRRCFENPVHAGRLAGEYADVLAAQTSESDKGAKVVLMAGVIEGAVAEMRFHVWGCPHLIAAAESVCGESENKPLLPPDEMLVKRLMELLSIPHEKMGRIFLLEDALNLLCRQYEDLKPG